MSEPCQPIDADGFPCDADCNDIAVSQYHEAYGNIFSGRSLRPANDALVPAVTVCKQSLWKPCSGTNFHQYNRGLYARECSKYKFRKRFNK